MSFSLFSPPSGTGSRLGSGISYTYHVSTVFNLECLHSLIKKTITFTELTFLKNTVPYTLIILMDYSSFPVCLIFVIIVRYHVGQNIA